MDGVPDEDVVVAGEAAGVEEIAHAWLGRTERKGTGLAKKAWSVLELLAQFEGVLRRSVMVEVKPSCAGRG